MKRDLCTEPLLTLADAQVRFGPVLALREVNLTLSRGDRLALVGANGAGKTTLLRLLHGLVRAPSTCPAAARWWRPCCSSAPSCCTCRCCAT
jgi:ABC-type uncharacterized transport system ATPase subunit